MPNKFDPLTGQWENVKERDEIFLQNSTTTNFQNLITSVKTEGVSSTQALVESIKPELGVSGFSSNVIMTQNVPLEVFNQDQNKNGGILYAFSFSHMIVNGLACVGVLSRVTPTSINGINGAFIGTQSVSNMPTMARLSYNADLKAPFRFPAGVGLWFFCDQTTLGGSKTANYTLF